MQIHSPLPETTIPLPHVTTTHELPPSAMVGNINFPKELLVKLQVQCGSSTLELQALVDTGARVALIVRKGTIKQPVPAPTALQFITADGKPMAGGSQGAWVDLHLPVCTWDSGALAPSPLHIPKVWAYEAEISCVDALIGYPFLVEHKIVPVPTRGILMPDKSFFALQSFGGAGVPSSPSSAVQVCSSPPTASHSPDFSVPSPTPGPTSIPPTSPPHPIPTAQEIAAALSALPGDWGNCHPLSLSPSLPHPGPSTPLPPEAPIRGIHCRQPPAHTSSSTTAEDEYDAINAWHSGNYCMIPQIVDQICAAAGFVPEVDAFANAQNARLPLFWDAQMDAYARNWHLHPLWINPPPTQMQQVVDKIVQDQAMGILVMPLWPSEPWFRLLANFAISWWDLPPEVQVFQTTGGSPILPPPWWRTRVVVFNAFDSLATQGKIFWQENIDNFCGQQCAQGEHPCPCKFTPILSVIDAATQAPGAESYIELLKEEFHDVLFDKIFAKDVDPALRGPNGVAQIVLKPDAKPKKDTPFRMLGVREQALKIKLEKAEANGWIQKCPGSEWGARAFVVPKPNLQPTPDQNQLTVIGPWSPCYGVKAPEVPDDELWRMVIDYRYLNSQCQDDSYPLPIIEDLITMQAENTIWSLFDLQDGFHQMHLDPQSAPMTAFVTPWGVWMWLVLPQGFKNSPSLFQRMMHNVVGHLPSNVIYIDDNMVGSRANEHQTQLEQHFQDVQATLTAFRKNKLTLKGIKCHLFMLQIKFCGHVLAKGTRRAAPSKLQAISKWTPSMITTVTHLKGFLGLAQYYAIYIPNFASTAYPLTEQLQGRHNKATLKSLEGTHTKQELAKIKRQTNKVVWTPEMLQAFEALKQQLLENVVLHIANPYKSYILKVDACDYGIGGVLCQEDDQGQERPVAFFSRKLQGKPGQGQRGWSVRDKETYAIVVALQKFRSWLASSQIHIKVETDHRSLQHWYTEDLNAISGPVGRRGRWHEFLSGFNLEVVYVQGKHQSVADALSRWAYGACQDPGDATLHGSVRDAKNVYHMDEEENRKDFHPTEELLSPICLQSSSTIPTIPSTTSLAAPGPSPSPPSLTSTASNLVAPISRRKAKAPAAQQPSTSTLHLPDWPYASDPRLGSIFQEVLEGGFVEGFWIHQGRLRHQHLMCVPESILKAVILELHDHQHAGVEKTLLMFKRRFEVGDHALLKKLTHEVVAHCPLCQTVKPDRTGQNKTLDYYPIPGEIFASLAVDFVDLPLVKMEAEDFDCAMVIVCRLSGYVMAIPCLKKGLTAKQAAWLFWRNCVHIMGLPVEIFSDKDHLIQSNFFKTLVALSGVSQYHSITYRPQGNGRAETAVRQVIELLRKHCWKSSHQLNQPFNWVAGLPYVIWLFNSSPSLLHTLSPHQLVFGRTLIGPLDTPSLPLPHTSFEAENFFGKMQDLWKITQAALMKLHTNLRKKFQSQHRPIHFGKGDLVWVKRPFGGVDGKLEPLFYGPGEVLEIIRPHRYLVASPFGQHEVHVDQLKPYIYESGSRGLPFNFVAPSAPLPESSTYQVERILAHRLQPRTGRLQWLVAWKGYGPEHNSWAYAEDFVHGIQVDWARYNLAHNLTVQLKDLRL